MSDIQLSTNFRLSELTKSDTAARLGIDNTPTDDAIIETLRTTVRKVLQPIRDHYAVSITPNSGFRCLELNRALKSKDTSQHVAGQAVDVEVYGVSNHDLAIWVKDHLDFDQMLLEFYYPDQPSSGWVHISYVSGIANRNQILTINKNGVFEGIIT